MTVETISLVQKHSLFEEVWSPKRIATLDNYELKLAKGAGSFDWHSHTDEDELFLVTQGVLRIEIEGQDAVILGPGELCVIPKGVRHRPVTQTETVHILLIEKAGVTNTGDNPDSDLTQTVVDI
ncbi:cupin [Maricaulis sp. W15]|uniref:Mannose-6-phosphate isomerase-like protein (Cupin superfamily) n=1 Tax=Maricaulis maris TaxID=74318 RepID=A0A495DJL8_9PROT|nr:MULTISPECIES: cupin domain-containing protein [Maricaulis]OLF78070.1 cupin [Maricaulis sp. W15]RKR02782.1 mannose-6-phosphate isomerase-like protein (cupin superfamily) [Maricaulis maris]